ncbi:anthrone oxygenase family protein [Bradyrhizobium sp. LA6.7]|uniref:anthrone oxygenase family protein n=1 Tax=unclassified Bradyrhizobium TaxID=2631580 RepID=UPI00339332E9
MRQFLTPGLLWFSAIGCGLMAGVYFAFSTFVMTSLARLGPVGATMMNAFISDIGKSLFMPVFLLTTLTSAALAVMAMFRWGQSGSVTMLVAGVLYVLGMFVVTIVFNQPLNEALTAADPASTEGAALWARYVTEWTFWNHVRTISSTVACVLFITAIAAR